MRILSLVVMLLHLSACATTFCGRSQVVRVAAQPSDATVQTGDAAREGSSDMPLTRSQNHTVQVERTGFTPQTVEIDRQVNEWFWLNFLWGPGFVLGMAVDAVTGAMWNLDPPAVDVALQPVAQ